MSKRTTRAYGWIKDKPDARDRAWRPRVAPTGLPDTVDLSGACPGVYDQLDIGSCTANAIGAGFEFDQMRQKAKVFTPSRLFIYFNEREMEGTTNEDSGASIRDGIKSVAKLGVCPEDMWVYDREILFSKPPEACYKAALDSQVISYMRVDQTVTMMRTCLAEGFPFVAGFMVYPSFESKKVASTGTASMPSLIDRIQGPVGGHAVLVVGYDQIRATWLIRNSWGVKWGKAGYFSLPYAYLADRKLASDFWTIRTVEG